MIDQPENLLGALALLVASRIEAAQDADDLGMREAAALALLGVLPRNVRELSEALQLTHSGAVRLVDRLAGEGWVRREIGRDARTVQVSLTVAGEDRRAGVLRSREIVLRDLMSALDAERRPAFAADVAALLGTGIGSPAEAVRTCRLCDEAACVPRGCPVEDRYQELAGPV